MDHHLNEPSTWKEEKESAKSLGKNTLIVYGVVLVTTFFFYLVYLLNSVILQLIIATIIAVALAPLVEWLMRRGMKRTGATSLAVIGTVLILLLITSLVATPLIAQGTKLIQNIPQIVRDLTHNQQLTFLNERYHLVDHVTSLSQEYAGSLAGSSLPLIGVFGRIISGISSFVIILIFSFFILLEGPEAWEKILHFLRPKQAQRARITAEKISHAVSGFVTGNLLISVIAGVVTLITLLLLHVPYAFALAALLAIFDLIPLVGAAIGTVAIALVALTQGLWVTIIVVAVMLIYQLVEGHFIQPLVYSRVISLSSLLIIFASVVGAELAGIIGVLLAIPFAAVIQIIVIEIFQLES